MNRGVPGRWLQLLCLMLCVMACRSGLAQKQVVVVAVDERNPPYSYVEGGQPKGIYVELLNAVSGAMPHFTIELRALPWVRALAEAERGAVGGVVPPYRRPGGRAWMAYSDALLVENNLVVCTPEVARTHDQSRFPDAFAGLTFANITGFLNAGAEFFEMVDAGKIELLAVSNVRQQLQMVAAGRVDCMVNSRRVIDFALRDLPAAEGNMARVGPPREEISYLGYNPRGPGGAQMAAFIREFNATLHTLRARKQVLPLDPL